MPLLTQNQRLNATLADDARNIAAHLAAASSRANGMVATMLSLDDAALTDWLNSQPPQETLALFGAHGQLGEALNGALAIAGAVLAASGLPAPQTAVDVRSVPEKLSDQGRIFAFEDGVFSVVTPPPVIEPEPAPEDPAGES
jgi:hypothetical protein